MLLGVGFITVVCGLAVNTLAVPWRLGGINNLFAREISGASRALHALTRNVTTA
jgi:hypothetical protein